MECSEHGTAVGIEGIAQEQGFTVAAAPRRGMQRSDGVAVELAMPRALHAELVAQA